MENYLVPPVGRVQLRQLRADQLVALYRRLATNGGRDGRPLAAKTILNLHRLLRVALEDAVERGLIRHNPAEDVRPPDPRKRPSPRRSATSWTARELGSFLAATKTNRYWMLSGSRPLPGCGAVSCSGSAGPTFTSIPGASRSPRR